MNKNDCIPGVGNVMTNTLTVMFKDTDDGSCSIRHRKW